MPSGRMDLIPDDYDIVDRRSLPLAEIPAPAFTPRENQQAAIDYIEKCGIINAKVGWGKTIAGLGLAHKFQTKTLIITPTTMIRDMWVAEVKKWFGFEAGVIGAGKYTNQDSPIVIGNIQTVRKMAQKLATEFGLVILDEVHRCPATTFTDTMNAFCAKHKVGLSGTLIRKDKKHVVLQDYFGHEIFVADDENRMVPEVHIWKGSQKLNSNEFIPWSTLITQLYSSKTYQSEVLKLANEYMNSGYQMLALSDRTDMLKLLHSQTLDRTCMITGTEGDRNAIITEISKPGSPIRGLWGTQSIFAEGVSINPLSCLLLSTPIGDNYSLLEQLIGRIQRKADGKRTPVVVDMQLGGSTGKRQANARMKFYIEKGWKIVNMGSVI